MKFVDALAQTLSVGVQKDVASLGVEGKHHTPDFRVVEWFAAANPQHGRFRLRSGTNGVGGAMAIFTRNAVAPVFVQSRQRRGRQMKNWPAALAVCKRLRQAIAPEIQ